MREKAPARGHPIRALSTVAVKLFSEDSSRTTSLFSNLDTSTKGLQSSLLIPPRDLYHWTRVMVPTVNEPKQHTDNHDPAKDQNAIVHSLDVRVLLGWPHGPKGPEQGVENRHNRDGDAEAAEPEGAPWDIGVWRSEALIQHDGCGEDEGRIVACYDKGDESAEADGGADVDKGEEEVNDSCGGDGVEGKVGALVDLECFVSIDSVL